jgi:hypothetical protein
VWTTAPEGCRTLGACPHEKDQMGDSSSNVTVEIYGTRGHVAIGALRSRTFIEQCRSTEFTARAHRRRDDITSVCTILRSKILRTKVSMDYTRRISEL